MLPSSLRTAEKSNCRASFGSEWDKRHQNCLLAVSLENPRVAPEKPRHHHAPRFRLPDAPMPCRKRGRAGGRGRGSGAGGPGHAEPRGGEAAKRRSGEAPVSSLRMSEFGKSGPRLNVGRNISHFCNCLLEGFLLQNRIFQRKTLRAGEAEQGWRNTSPLGLSQSRTPPPIWRERERDRGSGEKKKTCLKIGERTSKWYNSKGVSSKMRNPTRRSSNQDSRWTV